MNTVLEGKEGGRGRGERKGGGEGGRGRGEGKGGGEGGRGRGEGKGGGEGGRGRGEGKRSWTRGGGSVKQNAWGREGSAKVACFALIVDWVIPFLAFTETTYDISQVC